MLTPRENYINFFTNREYEWQPNNMDWCHFYPAFITDHVARGLVSQQEKYTGELGGKDMFGIEWIFDPRANGSMEVGTLFDDVEDWKDYVKFPDLDAIDWEKHARENAEFLHTDKLIKTTIYTSFFERLISFVGFENALMALVDDDQIEAVEELFDRLADTYIDLIGRMKKYFNVEYVEMHDDWGTQRATMFSQDVHRELVVPYIKKVVDGAHKAGVFMELHCCGKVETLLPNIIETGIDTWRGQPINDKKMLVDTYGDRFKFGVDIWVEGEVSDETALSYVKEAYEKWQGKNVWVFIRPFFPPHQREMIYNYIREHGKF